MNPVCCSNCGAEVEVEHTNDCNFVVNCYTVGCPEAGKHCKKEEDAILSWNKQQGFNPSIVFRYEI